MVSRAEDFTAFFDRAAFDRTADLSNWHAVRRDLRKKLVSIRFAGALPRLREREELHDEYAVPKGSRRIHNSILRKEVLENDRGDHNIRCGMHLRTHGRPSLQGEGVLESADALVVPQFQWEGRIRRVAEPHRPDSR